MKRFAVLLVALATLAAGCTRASSTVSVAGGRHPWTHPGLLRIAELGEADTLNPMLTAYQEPVDISMFWAGYLFNYDDRNQWVPELATTVPTLANGGISRDGLTITYHLRRGVTWQDGAPFTADDVVFSWHAVMNPENNVQTRGGYDDVQSIAEPDKYTAVVRLKHRFAPFVATFFTMSSAPMPVLPKHLLAQYPNINRAAYNGKPVGTGPFIVKSWQRGEAVRMVANPHYWRGAPKLHEVDFEAIEDENTIATTIRSHGIDLWHNAGATLYPVVKNIPDTHVILSPFTQYSYIGLNGSRGPLRDPEVRRALVYATDRKTLIDRITYGVQLLGEGDQPAFSWAHDPHLKPIPFDPARARAMLDAAGWHVGPNGIRTKNGVPLRLEVATTTGGAVGNRLAVLLQSAYRAVGVDLEVKQYAAAMMFAAYQNGGILQAGKFDLEFSSWVNGVDPDDSTTVTCAAIPPNGQNVFRFCDPVVDANEKIALTSYEQAVRARAYANVQEQLVQQVPFITEWFWRQMEVVSDDVHGFKPAHAVTPFWNTWELST
ncbi:MAG TPA: peptide ABC transporter substrate-binding protein [Candidatus Baltobacteraceae bacterium]|nr:peptide ABC transporter substrate-binding protein [Candidatus Baltobacteraceae bacterium]